MTDEAKTVVAKHTTVALQAQISSLEIENALLRQHVENLLSIIDPRQYMTADKQEMLRQARTAVVASPKQTISLIPPLAPDEREKRISAEVARLEEALTRSTGSLVAVFDALPGWAEGATVVDRVKHVVARAQHVLVMPVMTSAVYSKKDDDEV